MNLYHVLLLLGSSSACWFSSKKKSMSHIAKYMNTHGHSMDRGMSRRDFELLVDDMPGSLAWIVHKVGGIDKVMRKCDADGDGTVYIPEALKAKHCLVDCWKQTAVMTFLN